MGNKKKYVEDKGRWTWHIGRHQNFIGETSKSVTDPYVAQLDKLSTTFFVTNFPDVTNSNGLWKVFYNYMKIADIYIPKRQNKFSKGCAFVEILAVMDQTLPLTR